MADYDGGRVFLQVVPSFRGVQALISGEANKWGREAGKNFNDGFDRETGRRPVPLGPTSTESAKQGSSAGGSFADGFRRRVEAAMRALPPVKIGPAFGEVEQALRDLRLDLERLSDQTVGVDIDSSSAMAEIERIDQALSELDRQDADIQVRADTAAARTQLAAIQAQVNDLDADDVNIRVDADTSGATASLNTFTGRLLLLGAAGAALGPAIVPAAGVAAGALAAIGPAALLGLGGVGALAVGFQGVGDAVKAMVAVQEESGRASVRASGQQAAAAQQQAAAARQVEAAEASLANARTDAAAGAEQAARRIDRAQADVADAQAELADRVEDAQQRVADAQEALAREQESASRRVVAAQQNVADAQERLARQEEDAANEVAQVSRRVEDARRQATDVAERAAERTADALRRQERAELSLADAQQSARDAQQDLLDAREEAQRQIEDLTLDVESGALREQQAILGVEEARQRLDETIADPTATDLDKRQAKLSHDQAVQQLRELQLRNQRLREEQAATAAAGVEGSERVLDAHRRTAAAELEIGEAQRSVADTAVEVTRVRVQAASDAADAERSVVDAVNAAVTAGVNAARDTTEARRAVAEAIEQEAVVTQDAARDVADAQRAVADAAESAAEAQEAGAKRVADAQERVTDAVRAAADQQRQSTQAVESAQRSLEGAHAAVATAAATAGVTGTAAMNNLADSMANLSPAGQAFATFLFGLKPLWDDIVSRAQAGLLPGVQRGLEALLPVMPAISEAIAAFATVIGEMFARAGAALASPAWQKFFEQMVAAAPMLLPLGEAVGNLALAFGNLMLAFLPLTEFFIDALLDLSEAFLEWTTSPGFKSFIGQFIAYVIEQGPAVLGVFTALIGAVANLVRSMLPFAPVVLAIVTGFLNLVAAMPPAVLSGIVLAVLGLVAAFNLLAPLVAFIGTVLAAVSGGASILGGILIALGGPVTLIIAAIVLLGAALVAAYMHSETFRDVVDSVFRAIGAGATWLWEEAIRPAFNGISSFITDTLVPVIQDLWRNVIEPAFRGIQTAVQFAWQNVIKPALEAYAFYLREVVGPTVLWLWNEVIKPAWTGIQIAIDVAWTLIKVVLGAFEIYIRTVLAPVFGWLWNQVIKPAFEGIGSVITWAWDNVIKPVFEALGGFIENTVAPAFQRGVDAIKTIWDTIKDIAKAPVKFIIETVINDGIIGSFNWIAEKVPGVDKIDKITLPKGFATGGIYPGYTPGRDIGMIRVSGGEAIMRPEWTRAVGAGQVEAMNAAARTGGVSGVRRYLGGFASGGVVDAWGAPWDVVTDAAGWVAGKAGDVVGALKDAVIGGLKKAFQAAMKPMFDRLSSFDGGMFGDLAVGIGRKAVDSILGFLGLKDDETPAAGEIGKESVGGSGFRALIDFLRGTGVPFVNTSNLRPGDDGYHGRGKASDFSVAGHGNRGYAHPGLRAIFDAFLPAGGNLSELILAGAPFNIKNGKRVPGYAWGQPGKPGNHWNHVHAALFDKGGRLQPGFSTVLNATGSPELVLNGQQEGMIEAALRGRLVPGGPAAGLHIEHWHQEDRSGDPVAASRAAVLAMQMAF